MSLKPEAPSFDTVASFEALIRSAQLAAKGHRRSDDAAKFLTNLEAEVFELERELESGRYKPRPFRIYRISDPKPRQIAVADFRDRVVHHAVCTALAGVLDADAHPASFACRKGGGVLRALQHTQRLVANQPWVLKIDVRHFFETLDHSVLKRLLWRRVRDPRLRSLIDTIICVELPGSAPGKGLPIGNLTSQIFANFYLGPLDRHLQRGLAVAGQARYMDDILIFGESAEHLTDILGSVDAFLRSRLLLSLKWEVTRLQPCNQGLPFLGFVLWSNLIRFDRARRQRWYSKMNGLSKSLDRGYCSEEDAQRVAASLLGWSMHGDTLALRRAWAQRHT